MLVAEWEEVHPWPHGLDNPIFELFFPELVLVSYLPTVSLYVCNFLTAQRLKSIALCTLYYVLLRISSQFNIVMLYPHRTTLGKD